MCPSCRQGRIFTNRRQINRFCPVCGSVFYRPDDADWLVAWLAAYTAASLVLVGLVVVLQIYTTWNLWLQIAISGVIAGIVAAIGYPFFKGSAVGILFFMRNRWHE